MEQKYRIEYKFTFLEVDKGAPISDKKKWIYLEAVGSLLEMGVTNFRAKFTYCDPRTYKPESDFEYGLRDFLLNSRQVYLFWEFKYILEEYKILVESKGDDFTVKRVVLFKETSRGHEKIKAFYTPTKYVHTHLYNLKLEYGENIKVDFR